MEMNGLSTLSRRPELELHHKLQLLSYLEHTFWGGGTYFSAADNVRVFKAPMTGGNISNSKYLQVSKYKYFK